MKLSELRPDEKTLLTDLKSGNQAAFRHFYDKYHLQLYRKLLKMVQVEAVAEELLQDLFMKIWHKRELVDPEQSFKAYLYRIAEHIIADYFRKLAREIKLERETDLSNLNVYETEEDGARVEIAQQIINEAIDTLPAQQKLVFRLCKIDGKSYEEVSKQLNISHATINTHISRGSKAVKEYILKHHDGKIGLVTAYAVLEMIRQAI